MSIRKHKNLMFKLKYTSSLVTQKEKEIAELKARIDRGNAFIVKMQIFLHERHGSILCYTDGKVVFVNASHLGGVPKENYIKF